MASNTSSTPSSLTFEALQKTVREVYEKYGRPEPSFMDGLFKPLRTRFAGMDVYTPPPPPQKVSVRPIVLRDGTQLLSTEFIKEQNAWYAEQFGFHEPLVKPGTAYIMGSWGLMVSRPDYAKLVSVINCA